LKIGWNPRVSSPHVTYAAHRDANAEGELYTLANIYKFVLACHEKQEATRPGSPDDAKGSKNDRARQKYTG
jgi:hypothetical protein